MSCVAIIPARWASSRFPGKPLARIAGMTVIARTYTHVANAVDTVYVATDDQRIADEITSIGGNVIMTSSELTSGTERVFEAYCKLNQQFDTVINIQGDEPFIDPEQIARLIESSKQSDAPIATMAYKFNPDDGWDALFDPNSVKLVFDNNLRALYFSRSIIPYIQGKPWQEWINSTDHYIHIGIYVFKTSIIDSLSQLLPTPAAVAESLEQLTWLQSGFPIQVHLTGQKTIGIDTPDDLQKANILFSAS